MSRVTPKLQVTMPESIAHKYQIRPGDEIEWIDAGEAIHVVPAKALPRMLNTQERLKLFDEATARQRAREAEIPPENLQTNERGWTRFEIYDRDRTR